MTKKHAKIAAFAVAAVALIVVAYRHGEAALAVATGALAIIGGLAGVPLPGGF